jgi:hypothetical protein
MLKRLLIIVIIFLPLPMVKGQTQELPNQLVVVKAVAPTYPYIAASKEISGRVVIEAQIDSYGIVHTARFVDGPNFLRQSAERAAQKWIFAKDSQVEARFVNIFFIFKIVSKNTSSDELTPIFMPPYSVEVSTKVPELIFERSVDPPSYVRPVKTRRKH